MLSTPRAAPLRPGRLPAPPRAALLLALAAIAVQGCADPPRPRGIVLVVVDTLRADHLGLYGHRRPTSPGLDARAPRARVFEHAFSTSPWTMPAMGSIFTGRLPSRHGAGNRQPDSDWTHSGSLDGSLPTLAGRLTEAGFATHAIVNNPWLKPRFGFARGFSSYDYKTANNRRGRRADQVLRLAQAWLDQRGDEPFFLLVHLFDPHLSYDPPPPFRGRFSAGLERPPFAIGEPERVRERLDDLTPSQRAWLGAAYDEEIAYVDHYLGRFFTALEARGLAAETLFIVTSDHGEELFEHGGFEHGHTLFQEVLRVPLLIWGPGVAPGRDPTPVSLLDLAPTVLAAAGLEPIPDLPGRSLWPRPGGGDLPLAAESTLYGPERRALVRWPWKLVTDESSGGRRLHDLAADPEERADRSAAEPARAGALTRELADLLEAARREARGDRVPLDEETLEELRAVGYLEAPR